jgi:hypothetical protein
MKILRFKPKAKETKKFFLKLNLMTKPVECDEFSSTELSGDLEEHGAHERHSTIDGCAAEGVPENEF